MCCIGKWTSPFSSYYKRKSIRLNKIMFHVAITIEMHWNHNLFASKVLKSTGTQAQLSLEGLASGVYFLSVGEERVARNVSKE